jgi:pimeloyl-ACP methyl ester carboxylesterase
MMPSSWAYQKPWEDFFTVVNWDQRGVGKSFSAADSARLGASLTNEQLVADAEVVVERLRQRLGKDKVILMGFSWGSVIGPYVVQRHPEWFHAYVGVGQSADDGEVALFRRLLAIAERAKNDTALKELKAMAPYPDSSKPPKIEQALAIRKWARYFDGGWYGKRDFKLWFSMQEWSPEYTDADAANFLPAMAWAGRHIVGGDPKLWDKAPTALAVPVIILQGRHDLHTPWDAAKVYFDSIVSPRKSFITFERSAHFPMFEEPGRFLMTLVTEVRPLAGPDVSFARQP